MPLSLPTPPDASLDGAADARARERRLLIPAGGVALGFIIAGFVWTRHDPKHALRLAYEDGGLEWTQCLILLAAAAALLGAIRNGFAWGSELRPARRLLICGVIVVGVAVAEELSWGQRLLAFDVPESLTAFNHQGELTLHNLSILQPVRHYLQAAPFAVLLLISLWPLRAKRAWLRLCLPPRGMAVLAALTLVPYATYFVMPEALGVEVAGLHEYWRLRILTELGETLGYWTILLHSTLLWLRTRAIRHARTP